ncbi:MAG: hypothetical protein L6R42_009466, partial [Xanthoria sp. 1 TBL-2021]
MHSKPAFLLALSLCTREAVCHITRPVNWFPCTRNGTLPIMCGTLTVLLDYVNATSNAALELQLVKVSAVKQPKKGSILFNPGGPGSPGRDLIAGAEAPSLLVATGGYHDLIGFDPRYAFLVAHILLYVAKPSPDFAKWLSFPQRYWHDNPLFLLPRRNLQVDSTLRLRTVSQFIRYCHRTILGSKKS